MKLRDTSKPATRIKDTGCATRKIKHEVVAKALGAIMDKPVWINVTHLYENAFKDTNVKNIYRLQSIALCVDDARLCVDLCALKNGRYTWNLRIFRNAYNPFEVELMVGVFDKPITLAIAQRKARLAAIKYLKKLAGLFG